MKPKFTGNKPKTQNQTRLDQATANLPEVTVLLPPNTKASDVILNPKKYKRIPIKRALTPKEALFVKEILSGTDPAIAVKNAGFTVGETGKDKSPTHYVNRVINRPPVQRALAEAIEEAYPKVKEKVAERLNEMLNAPIRYSRAGGEGISPTEFLALANFLSDIFGWKAAKESRVLKADVTRLVKLPGAD